MGLGLERKTTHPVLYNKLVTELGIYLGTSDSLLSTFPPHPSAGYSVGGSVE